MAFKWRMVTPQSAIRLSGEAVVGGHESWDGSPLWVIRASHGGDLIPGKLAVTHAAAYVPYNGNEVPVHNIEVLTAVPGRVQWVRSSNGFIPPRAVVGGRTLNGESLYIGRAEHNNAVTPGKVQPTHETCYISFSGKEVAVSDYEVLCSVEIK